MIVENTRQDQIKNLIVKVANKTYGITTEHIKKAVIKYINDDRDLEIIEKELLELSAEIERTAREAEKKAREVENAVKTELTQSKPKTVPAPNQPPRNIGSSPELPEQSVPVVDMPDNDNQPETKRQEPTTEDVNLQEPTIGDNLDELSAMFIDYKPPKQAKQPAQTYTMSQPEKAKSLVKTNASPTGNNKGQASLLNLCFIFSTITILGLFISTVLINLQKLFN